MPSTTLSQSYNPYLRVRKLRGIGYAIGGEERGLPQGSAVQMMGFPSAGYGFDPSEPVRLLSDGKNICLKQAGVDHLSAKVDYDFIESKNIYRGETDEMFVPLAQEEMGPLEEHWEVVTYDIDPGVYLRSHLRYDQVLARLEGLNTPEEHARRASLKADVKALLGVEEGTNRIGPEAIGYACRFIDQFPPQCFALPLPDVSATSDGEIYFEWMPEKDGRLLLTVAPNGSVAYVCTFGHARSRNMGEWEDGLSDLIAPCFDKLLRIQQEEIDATLAG